MTETHVVTCFLLDPKGRLLLLRRGSSVGSYRGRWAGVSGYLETDPLEQAFTEMREEVGLDRQDLILLSVGQEVKVEDPGLERVWVVHPFLFRVKDPTRVRLDWEHSEYRWIDPSELSAFPTVPGLAEALGRVYPPPGR